MPIEKIAEKLRGILKTAEEIWIASALITDEGFSFIQSNLSDNTIQHYSCGIQKTFAPISFDET